MIVTLQDATGETVATEEIDGSAELTVIVVKRNSDGTHVARSFEPHECDNHPDTLRQIGGQVFDFAKRS